MTDRDTVRLHEIQHRLDERATTPKYFAARAPEDIRVLLGLTREMAAIIADQLYRRNEFANGTEVDAIRARAVLSRIEETPQ